MSYYKNFVSDKLSMQFFSVFHFESYGFGYF